MTDTQDLEDRIRRLEEEVGIDEPGLPEFQDAQMVERLAMTHVFDFYIDEMGDLWIVDPDDSPDDGFYWLPKGEVEAILESMNAHE